MKPMTTGERLLHEAIIRGLQTILNAWRKYLEERSGADETSANDTV